MFGKEKIPFLESQIAEDAMKLRQARLRSAALAAYGVQQANGLSDYYDPLIASEYQQLRSLLESMPADYVAGWNEKSRWRDWTPSELHESSWLRIGDLKESPPSNQTIVPGFLPFISQK